MLKYIFPLALVLVACGGHSKNEKETPKKPETVVAHFSSELDMNNRMVEIDALVKASDLVASSLNYMKPDGSFVKVLAYLNKEKIILKIEEQFSNGNNQTNGSITYYMNDGKPFITHELLDEANGAAHEFVDRVSYYDKNGKVIKTKERRAGFQDDAEKMGYTPVGLHAVKIDRAMRALHAEKEFETTFQGFAYQDALTYLIIGENTPDGYTSSLKCDFQDQLLFQLSKKPETQIGKKLNVTFVVEEDQGFEYQVYTGGSFVK